MNKREERKREREDKGRRNKEVSDLKLKTDEVPLLAEDGRGQAQGMKSEQGKGTSVPQL